MIKDLEDKGLLWEDKSKKMQGPRKFLTTEAESLQNLKDSQLAPEHIKE